MMYFKPLIPAPIKTALLILLTLLLALAAGCAWRSAGKGAQAAGAAETIAPRPDTHWYAANPNATNFIISTGDELAGLAAIVNGTWGGTPARDDFYGDTIRLANDIDLSRYDNWVPIGNFSADSASVFFGTFDGGRHTISNLTINRPDADYQGLFGYLRGDSWDIRLYRANVSGRDHAGRMAGKTGIGCFGYIASLIVGGTLCGRNFAGERERRIDSDSLGNYFDSTWDAPSSEDLFVFSPKCGNFSVLTMCSDCNSRSYRWSYSEGLDYPEGGRKAGYRTRGWIQRTVEQKLKGLSEAYDARVRYKPGLSGTVTVRFTIKHAGNVVLANVAETTMGDPEFEAAVADSVRSLDFKDIASHRMTVEEDAADDLTEVFYPFTFPVSPAAFTASCRGMRNMNADTIPALDTSWSAGSQFNPNTAYDSIAYNGQTYRTVKIGTRVWMAENLNFETGNSWCYGDDDSNCKKFGRLYDWNTAMSVCRAPWRLPDSADWNALIMDKDHKYADSKIFKTKIGWKDWKNRWKQNSSYASGNGTDELGFSALPGGLRSYDGCYYNAGSDGYWWSAAVNEDGGIDFVIISPSPHISIYPNSNRGEGYSVRCVQ